MALIYLVMATIASPASATEAVPTRRAMMDNLSYWLQFLVLLTVAVASIGFFDFTAEDAYITYRYAENLVNTGALVYNLGEPINAMTSPLHALVSAVLFLVTGNTALSNKLMGLLLLITSAWLVWSRFRTKPQWAVLALVLVLLPPSVLLWTCGGLETPLLLALATTIITLADRIAGPSFIALCVVFGLGSLAFLTRYDSVLFFLPVLLFVASRARSLAHVMTAAAIAAVPLIAWFAISLTYYGDLLPTSFYVKTPDASWGRLATNVAYIVSNLFFVGLAPVMLLVGTRLLQRRGATRLVSSHLRHRWWLYSGLLLELIYGLTMATHHMMFSFRFFVPYLPAAAIVAVELARSAFERIEAGPGKWYWATLVPGLVLGLFVFQAYQVVYTYDRSVNGISQIGEYQALGVRDYIQFMQILRLEALDIEQHWSMSADRPDRQPRIITYAAGMLPYTFRDSYIYEKLVSYRHCHQRYQQALYADYIHILAPRQGTVAQQLPKAEHNYSLVSTYSMLFDGSPQSFLVYFNPEPEAHNLSSGISDACD